MASVHHNRLLDAMACVADRIHPTSRYKRLLFSKAVLREGRTAINPSHWEINFHFVERADQLTLIYDPQEYHINLTKMNRCSGQFTYHPQIDMDAGYEALIIAKNYMMGKKDIQIARLQYMLKIHNYQQEAWHLEYLCNNHSGQTLHVHLRVHGETGIIFNVQMATV